MGPELFAASAGVSAILGAVSAINQAERLSDAEKFNARVAQNDAIAAEQAAQFDETRARERTRRLISQQRAAFGAAGVTSEGSPLEVFAQTAEDAEIDALAIRYSGAVQAQRKRAQAEQDRESAAGFRSAGRFRAATSLLTGTSNVARSGLLDPVE